MLQDPDVVIPHTIFKCVQSFYRVHFQEGGEEVNTEGRAKKLVLFSLTYFCTVKHRVEAKDWK